MNHNTHNRLVVGSNPTEPTSQIWILLNFFYCAALFFSFRLPLELVPNSSQD